MTKNLTYQHIIVFLFAILLMLAPLLSQGAIKKSKISENVNKALVQGLTWRSSVVGKAQMFPKVIKGYVEYAGWIYPMRGLRMPMKIALTAHAESKFKTYAKTKDLKMAEVGFLSVKRSIAVKHNINACHAELNIWAAQTLWHERRNQLHAQWPWLKDADEDQQRIIVDMAHGAGIGATTFLVNKATHGGKVNTDFPYDAVVKLVKAEGNKLRNKKYTCFKKSAKNECISRWGKVDASVIAFRVGLAGGMHERAKELQNGKFCTEDTEPDWQDIKPSSSEQYPFPGHSKHRRCQIFKEIKDLAPPKSDNEFWLNEMDKEGCKPKLENYKK